MVSFPWWYGAPHHDMAALGAVVQPAQRPAGIVRQEDPLERADQEVLTTGYLPATSLSRQAHGLA